MAGDEGALAFLIAPVSDADPCGPDLELAGDPEFLQTIGRIEGLLPSAYFSRDDEGRLLPFDRASIDAAAELGRLKKLLEASRDLRLLTIYGRLTALDRDLAGLAAAFAGVAALLRDRWDDVHPRGNDGDYALRMAVLQALDDMPTVVLPLQHVTLFESRRYGPVHFRTFMVAVGEVAGREDQPGIDRAGVDRAISEADLDSLKTTRDRLSVIRDASRMIQGTSQERAGHEGAVALDRVPALVDRILAFLEPVILGRDPAAAVLAIEPGPSAGPGSALVADSGSLTAAPQPRIRNHVEAVAALSAVSGYLRRFEPSSPVEPLVGQAGRLVGKSFVEVIRLLAPAGVDRATIAIGADRAFELSLDQLEAASMDETRGGSAIVEGGSTEGGGSGPDLSFRVASRADTVALLQQVASFFRVAEPSSPVPLLLERAWTMVDRDFLAILRDILPNAAD